jgi:hypothetical protein
MYWKAYAIRRLARAMENCPANIYVLAEWYFKYFGLCLKINVQKDV